MKDNQSALIVIDVQRDFCPGGSLSVPGGDEIIEVINGLTPTYPLVAATKDWHPAGHISFASSHEGASPYKTITLDDSVHVVWPDHCVAGTVGAQLHEALDLTHVSLILHKGMDRDMDSYSAFLENDHRTPTGLHGYLQEHGIQKIDLCGLATDICVYHTALDALALGYELTILTEACRGVDMPGGTISERLDELDRLGAHLN